MGEKFLVSAATFVLVLVSTSAAIALAVIVLSARYSAPIARAGPAAKRGPIVSPEFENSERQSSADEKLLTGSGDGSLKESQFGDTTAHPRPDATEEVAGEPVRPLVDHIAASPIKQIAVGGGFACALHANGDAECRGRTGTGQLGTSGENFVQVVAHSWDLRAACGRRDDGSVKCWSLGEAGPKEAALLRLIESVTDCANLFVGRTTCVIRKDQIVQCIDSTNSSWKVISLAANASFLEIDPGPCAVRQNGSLTCWDNDTGRRDPKLETRGQFLKIASAWPHQCGLTRLGAVVCRSFPARYGWEAAPPPPLAPVPVEAGPFVEIAVGSKQACAIGRNARLWCFGSADSYWKSAPTGEEFSSLEANSGDMCAVRVNGTGMCAGPRLSGEWDAIPPFEKPICLKWSTGIWLSPNSGMELVTWDSEQKCDDERKRWSAIGATVSARCTCEDVGYRD